jgi:peptidoglycan/LPS O-acetylase OafA/YrhL
VPFSGDLASDAKANRSPTLAAPDLNRAASLLAWLDDRLADLWCSTLGSEPPMSLRTSLPKRLAEAPLFSDILARNRGVGPGFDLLRIGLAAAILYGHALFIAGWPPVHAITGASAHSAGAALAAPTPWDGPKRPLHVMLVPMFFALSGFLVAGSALRVGDIKTFVALRVLRLFPSLVVEVLLSAFFLGALFTTLPPGRYFTHPGLFRYLLNMFGLVDMQLPGVFTSNPVSGVVNANLWTLPSELHCYLLLIGLMFAGVLRRRKLYAAVYALATVALVFENASTNFGVEPGPVSPECLVYYFCTGLFFFLWRDRLRFNWLLFCAMAALSYALLMSRHLVFAAGLPLTYVTCGLGLIRWPKIPIVQSGDYSYGVYLSGFPISQALVAGFPALVGHRFLVLGLTMPLSALFAAFSWHAIEKHCLKLKVYLAPRASNPKPAERRAEVRRGVARKG